MNPNFTIYTDKFEINNITSLKEFNDKIFKVEVDKVLYLVKGENMNLDEVLNNNSSIKVSGKFKELSLYNSKPKPNKNFFKRLLS